MNDYLNDNVDQIYLKLLSDLEIGQDDVSREDRIQELSALFEDPSKLTPQKLKSVGPDMATLLACSGDWAGALRWIEQLRLLQVDQIEYRLLNLRALVELKRFSDALNLVQMAPWPKSVLIQVNYLMAIAFAGLGMRTQALARLDSVKKVSPNYRDVLKLYQELQG